MSHPLENLNIRTSLRPQVCSSFVTRVLSTSCWSFRSSKYSTSRHSLKENEFRMSPRFLRIPESPMRRFSLTTFELLMNYRYHAFLTSRCYVAMREPSISHRSILMKESSSRNLGLEIWMSCYYGPTWEFLVSLHSLTTFESVRSRTPSRSSRSRLSRRPTGSVYQHRVRVVWKRSSRLPTSYPSFNPSRSIGFFGTDRSPLCFSTISRLRFHSFSLFSHLPIVAYPQDYSSTDFSLAYRKLLQCEQGLSEWFQASRSTM